MELNRNARNKVLEKCTSGGFTDFGRFHVEKYEIFDGFKFFFTNGAWLLIRSSGTEPLLRLYAESEKEAETQEIIFSGMKAIMQDYLIRFYITFTSGSRLIQNDQVPISDIFCENFNISFPVAPP